MLYITVLFVMIAVTVLFDSIMCQLHIIRWNYVTYPRRRHVFILNFDIEGTNKSIDKAKVECQNLIGLELGLVGFQFFNPAVKRCLHALLECIFRFILMAFHKIFHWFATCLCCRSKVWPVGKAWGCWGKKGDGFDYIIFYTDICFDDRKYFQYDMMYEIIWYVIWFDM